MNIRHSSRTYEWGTPSWLIEKCRRVLGTIDLDPCSTEEWNKTIKATKFLDKNYDSLKNNWCTTPQSIFINPPGGKLGNKSLTSLYWSRLCDHYDRGWVAHAIWMGFSLEQLAISQNYEGMTMLYFPICVPRSRVQFDEYREFPGTAPSHSNFILYVPGRIDNTHIFTEEFKDLGAISL